MDQMIGNYTSKTKQRDGQWLYFTTSLMWQPSMLTVHTLKVQYPQYQEGLPYIRILKKLAKDIVTPQIQYRLQENPHLHCHVIEAMKQCGMNRERPQEMTGEGPMKKKRHKLCLQTQWSSGQKGTNLLCEMFAKIILTLSARRVRSKMSDCNSVTVALNWSRVSSEKVQLHLNKIKLYLLYCIFIREVNK